MADEGAVARHESIVNILWEFARHIVLVTGAFLIIFAVAIGLDQLVRALKHIDLIETGTPLEWALIGAKYSLLAADLALLGVLLVKYGLRAARKL